MFQPMQKKNVSYKGAVVKPNLKNAVLLERKQKSEIMDWCFIVGLKGAWFMIIGCIFVSLYLGSDELRGCINLPSISSAQKSLDADGKFGTVSEQEGLLSSLIGITNASKLHGTQTAQEQIDLAGFKQQNEAERPMMLRIQRYTNSNETQRSHGYIDFHVSSSSSCKLPTGLRTAEILCKIWTHSITCESYCVYGSTYKEGIVRSHFCKYKENKWSKKFEECKPFVDCKPKLVSPGKIKCLENSITESTTCEISCEKNEAEGTDNKSSKAEEGDTDSKTNEIEGADNKSSEAEEGDTDSKTNEVEGADNKSSETEEGDTDSKTNEVEGADNKSSEAEEGDTDSNTNEVEGANNKSSEAEEGDTDSETTEVEGANNKSSEAEEGDTDNTTNETEGDTDNTTNEPEGELDNKKDGAKEDTDNNMYECKIDGTWGPPLPSCVALKGIPLVKTPKVAKHENVSYPEIKEIE